MTALQELNIIEPVSFEVIKQRLIERVLATNPEMKLYESDEKMVLINAFAYELVYRNEMFNQRLKFVLPIFAKKENLDVSCENFYGTYRLEGESDEAFLERSLLSLQQSSTAGAEWSYIYHVKSVDSRIVDVLPFRVRAGVVHVTWYANESDNDELLSLNERIERKLIDEKIKPLGDKTHYVGDEELEISQAVEVPFSINATLRIKLGVDGDAVRAEALKQFNAYILSLMIGQDIKVNKLIAVLDVNGVDEVVLNAPVANVTIDKYSIAKLQSIDMGVEGLIDV